MAVVARAMERVDRTDRQPEPGRQTNEGLTLVGQAAGLKDVRDAGKTPESTAQSQLPQIELVLEGGERVDAAQYLGRITPIKPITPGSRSGDRYPHNPAWDKTEKTKDKSDSFDITDVVDLSPEAIETMKRVVAVALAIGAIGIAITVMPQATPVIIRVGPRLLGAAAGI